MLAFRANARYGVPNTEDERLSQAVDLMDSEVTLSQAAAICMFREGALRTRWNKRQADRRQTRSACCATSGAHCCRRCAVGC
jgi:hypothetical protein